MNQKYYYDIVWTDYQYEKELTTTQMQEKEHVDEMIKRVSHLQWKDEPVSYTHLRAHET